MKFLWSRYWFVWVITGFQYLYDTEKSMKPIIKDINLAKKIKNFLWLEWWTIDFTLTTVYFNFRDYNIYNKDKGQGNGWGCHCNDAFNSDIYFLMNCKLLSITQLSPMKSVKFSKYKNNSSFKGIHINHERAIWNI